MIGNFHDRSFEDPIKFCHLPWEERNMIDCCHQGSLSINIDGTRPAEDYFEHIRVPRPELDLAPRPGTSLLSEALVRNFVVGHGDFVVDPGHKHREQENREKGDGHN